MEAISRETERSQLTARRARVVEMYEDGAIGRDEYHRRLAAILQATERLLDQEQAATIIKVPEIDWSRSPEVTNAVLRALWERVDFDSDMQPASATWTVPEWRAA